MSNLEKGFDSAGAEVQAGGVNFVGRISGYEREIVRLDATVASNDGPTFCVSSMDTSKLGSCPYGSFSDSEEMCWVTVSVVMCSDANDKIDAEFSVGVSVVPDVERSISVPEDNTFVSTVMADLGEKESEYSLNELEMPTFSEDIMSVAVMKDGDIAAAVDVAADVSAMLCGSDTGGEL